MAAALRHQSQLRVAEVHCTFDPTVESIPAALDRICAQAEAVVAVHQQLVRTALRVRAGLVVEAGDCWDVHRLAVLIGFGAGAVCPWLALHSARATHPENGE